MHTRPNIKFHEKLPTRFFFKDIEVSCCFLWEGNLYQKTDNANKAVHLSKGVLITLTDNCIIDRVNVNIEAVYI